jgi:hypothetical protein
VEVGVYPSAGQVELDPQDFALRVKGEQSSLIRPVGGQSLAGAINRKSRRQYDDRNRPGSASEVTVYPTVGVGVISGRDPYTGQRRTGTVTNAGVGVGVGGVNGPYGNGPYGGPTPPPGATDRDRDIMRDELTDQGLPAGPTAQPVAGYLYFPRPDGGKKRSIQDYELVYYGNGTKQVLNLPAHH